MPNHFHFLIHANKITETIVKTGLIPSNKLSEAVRTLLSSYAKCLNHQHGRRGNLFQQNSKSKWLASEKYINNCFHYIHQNAWKAGLVNRIEDWEYCSFLEFTGKKKNSLCNLSLAFEILDLNQNTFYDDSYAVIDVDSLAYLF